MSLFDKNPFARAVKDVTLSIRVTEEARKALELLAADVGVTHNRYVAKLIEVHLSDMANQGKIPNPETKPKSKKK